MPSSFSRSQMSCQTQSTSGLISHLPPVDPPQGPLSRRLEQRAMGQMPPVIAQHAVAAALAALGPDALPLRGAHELGVHRRKNPFMLVAPGHFLHAAAAGHGQNRIHLIHLGDQSSTYSGSHCRSRVNSLISIVLPFFMKAICSAEARMPTSLRPPAAQTVTHSLQPTRRGFDRVGSQLTNFFGHLGGDPGKAFAHAR
jgi:hypothetical protein